MFAGRLVELRGFPRSEAVFATTATIGCAFLTFFFGLLSINMTIDLLRRRILTVSHESIVDHRLKGFTIAFRHVRAMEVVYGLRAPQAIRFSIDRLWPPAQSRFRVGCLTRSRQGQVTLSIGFLNRPEPDIVAAVLAIAEQHAIPIGEAQVRRAVPKGRTFAPS